MTRSLFIRHKDHYSHINGKNGTWGAKLGFYDSKCDLTLWKSLNGQKWFFGSGRMQ